MDEGDFDLKLIKEDIGEKLYKKHMRFFKGVAKNANDALKESFIYITQESLERKLKQHLGHQCDFFAKRFFAFLSDNISAMRISFKQYYHKVNKTLFSGSLYDEMKFFFAFLDIDQNGILSGPDLLTVQDSVD